MGYEYHQQFEIANLLKGKTIDVVKFVDREGSVGLSVKFTDGSELYIKGNLDEETLELTFGSTSNWDNRDRCSLDVNGYWGPHRGDWRREDQGG